MPISDRSKIVKQESTLLQELDNEAVLLNLNNNQYYRLDADSLRMFTVLTSSSDFSSAVNTLNKEYDVATEQLRKDLEAFVDTLLNAGIVEIKDDIGDEPLE